MNVVSPGFLPNDPNANDLRNTILGGWYSGQEARDKQLGMSADKMELDFDNRETQRLLIWGDPKRSMEEKMAFLETEKRSYMDALRARNKALGRRMTDQQIQDIADSYFARYRMGGNAPIQQKAGEFKSTPAQGGTQPAPTPAPQQPGYNEEPQDWSVQPIGSRPNDPSSLGHYGERVAYGESLGGTGYTQSDRIDAMQKAASGDRTLGELVPKTDPGGQKPDYISSVFAKVEDPSQITQEEADAMWDFMVANPTAIPGFKWTARNPAKGQPKASVLETIQQLVASNSFRAYAQSYSARQAAIGPLTIPRGAGPVGENAPLPPPLPAGLNQEQSNKIWDFLLKNPSVVPPTTLRAAAEMLRAIDANATSKANGGATSEPTLALIGEGGEREFVVPESKAPLWAQLLLQNPQNPPNPANVPRIPNGGMGIPMLNGGGDSNDLARQQEMWGQIVQNNPAPQNVPASADTMAMVQNLASPGALPPGGQPPAAAPNTLEPRATPNPESLPSVTPTKDTAIGIKIPIIDKKPAKFDEAASVLTESDLDAAKSKNPILGRLWEEKPEMSGQIESVGKKVKAKAADLLKGTLKNSPETQQFTAEMNKGFTDWYKNAEPEEIALFLGDKNAAAYRDKKLDRELAYGELALKWKYYELQERAAQGDQVASMFKFALDIGKFYMEQNQEVIQKKGIKTVRSEDPMVDSAAQLIEFVMGAKPTDWEKVGFFGKKVGTEIPTSEWAGRLRFLYSPAPTSAGAAPVAEEAPAGYTRSQQVEALRKQLNLD